MPACPHHPNRIIDTKHLASHPLINPLLFTTGLEGVSERVQNVPFTTVGPKIGMSDGDYFIPFLRLAVPTST
jgi:hypothetical protein